MPPVVIADRRGAGEAGRTAYGAGAQLGRLLVSAALTGLIAGASPVRWPRWVIPLVVLGFYLVASLAQGLAAVGG